MIWLLQGGPSCSIGKRDDAVGWGTKSTGSIPDRDLNLAVVLPPCDRLSL